MLKFDEKNMKFFVTDGQTDIHFEFQYSTFETAALRAAKTIMFWLFFMPNKQKLRFCNLCFCGDDNVDEK